MRQPLSIVLSNPLPQDRSVGSIGAKRSRVKTLFEAPLFCPIYHSQPINRVLSPDTVKRLVKEGAKLADVDPVEAREFSGHSMRVGTAQDLLRRGFDTAAIMRAGGWSSINVVSRYLAHAEHNMWECFYMELTEKQSQCGFEIAR